MSKIVVFGAGGRAGRRVVEEALARGHQVSAVVRRPGEHEFAAEANVVGGDVTDATSVAAAAAGHDAAIVAVYRADVDAESFYVSATSALLAGLERAGVGRLLVVGLGATLEVTPGTRVMDAPDFPADFRAFSAARAAELAALRASKSDVDWVVMAPPPVVLDADAPASGAYRLGTSLLEGDGRPFAYADLAVALVDEVERARHHRELVSVGY